MVTALDKALKRQITVDGVDYVVAIDPEGFRVTGKGRRKPEVALLWRDLLSGDAAMAVALNVSLMKAPRTAATGGSSEAAVNPGRRAGRGRRKS